MLQDVHWYSSEVGGAFQGYTLGNVMSVIWYDAAVKAEPSIPDRIRRGEFATLHAWLRENIYRHGRKFTAPELLTRVTGSPKIDPGPYLRYLRQKFGKVYELDLDH